MQSYFAPLCWLDEQGAVQFSSVFGEEVASTWADFPLPMVRAAGGRGRPNFLRRLREMASLERLEEAEEAVGRGDDHTGSSEEELLGGEEGGKRTDDQRRSVGTPRRVRVDSGNGTATVVVGTIVEDVNTTRTISTPTTPTNLPNFVGVSESVAPGPRPNVLTNEEMSRISLAMAAAHADEASKRGVSLSEYLRDENYSSQEIDQISGVLAEHERQVAEREALLGVTAVFGGDTSVEAGGETHDDDASVLPSDLHEDDSLADPIEVIPRRQSLLDDDVPERSRAGAQHSSSSSAGLGDRHSLDTSDVNIGRTGERMQSVRTGEHGRALGRTSGGRTSHHRRGTRTQRGQTTKRSGSRTCCSGQCFKAFFTRTWRSLLLAIFVICAFAAWILVFFFTTHADQWRLRRNFAPSLPHAVFSNIPPGFPTLSDTQTQSFGLFDDWNIGRRWGDSYESPRDDRNLDTLSNRDKWNNLIRQPNPLSTFFFGAVLLTVPVWGLAVRFCSEQRITALASFVDAPRIRDQHDRLCVFIKGLSTLLFMLTIFFWVARFLAMDCGWVLGVFEVVHVGGSLGSYVFGGDDVCIGGMWDSCFCCMWFVMGRKSMRVGFW